MSLPLNQIICGDCLEVMKDWPDKCIDLVLTDPPYGHNNQNGDLASSYYGETATMANDGPEANELVRTMFYRANRILKPGCCCCCCGGGGGPDPQFARWSLWLDEAIGFKMCVPWYKGGWGMGLHYRRCYECILIGQKTGGKSKWCIDTTVENIILDIRKPRPGDDSHPTEKPIELMSRFIEWHSQEDDIVLDPFCGSGTTCVAAKMLGRNYIGIDISEKYCQIARDRLEAVEKGITLQELKSGQQTLFGDNNG